MLSISALFRNCSLPLMTASFMRTPLTTRYSRTPLLLQKRKAVAAVELAFCLPIIVLIVCGGIETCNMIYLKQAITEAAYHGAVVGSRPNATHTKVVNSIQAMLDARHLKGTTISVGNGAVPVEDILPGELVTVRISVANSSNQISPTRFIGSQPIDATSTARKL